MPLRPFSLRSHQHPLSLVLRPDASANANYKGLGASLRCRGLHATRCLRSDVQEKNHYERLHLRHDASPADIKKSYFALSKTHHPDTNRSDPNASHTFSLISESYKVLSDPSRRATYDRDVLRLHHHPHHHRPHGSYHSTHQPAGGRAPSGLSRRRGTFRGPPPSFYRSGGWGGQADKRQKAHEESTGTGSSESTSSQANAWTSAWSHQNSYGGMGPGSDPFHQESATGHFDKAGHTRTQTREDYKRVHRVRRAMGAEDIEYEAQSSVAGHFLIITGILAATLLAPLLYVQFLKLGTTRKDKDR